jgi:hypothetical protein
MREDTMIMQDVNKQTVNGLKSYYETHFDDTSDEGFIKWIKGLLFQIKKEK